MLAGILYGQYRIRGKKFLSAENYNGFFVNPKGIGIDMKRRRS